MNWHGKPLGAKAEEVIAHLEKEMTKKNGFGLKPQPITASVPKADITNIKLSEPPKYELGQQVAQCIYLHGWVIHSSVCV